MLAEHLENYLQYMKQMGFSGLKLEENPFRRVQTPSKAAAMMPPPGPRPMKPPALKPKEPAKSAKGAMPNLSSLLDMAGVAGGPGETAQKVLNVAGSTPVETLKNLYRTFHDCQACALGSTRKRFVFGEGPPDARLMFVGESPSVEDDQSGRPFLGEAGQLLDKIIEAMGFQRAGVFIANVVKCLPPHERTPLTDEVASCSPILAKQISVVNPQVIVALGATALSFFKGEQASIMRSRGQFYRWRGHMVMPTHHPSYILRNPSAKREVWEDMKKVMAELKKPV